MALGSEMITKVLNIDIFETLYKGIDMKSRLHLFNQNLKDVYSFEPIQGLISIHEFGPIMLINSQHAHRYVI